MQFQRSLFSFYKVFVRKTPIMIWIAFAVVLALIVGEQVSWLYRAKPTYNFEQCFMQYFNATRFVKNNTQPANVSQNPAHTGAEKPQQTQNQDSFLLDPSFYQILNQSTLIKIYLSDQIELVEGKPNCKIVLNTQKLRKNKYKKKEPEAVSKENSTQIIYFSHQNSSVSQKFQSKNNDKNTQPQQNQSQEQIQKEQIFVRQGNVKNFDQITDEEFQILTKEHSFMHFTANQHIIHLDPEPHFQEKHGIKSHAVFLSKQGVEEYPNQFLGISSNFWRLHGNKNITLNGNMLRSISQTFSKVENRIVELYKKFRKTFGNSTSTDKVQQELNLQIFSEPISPLNKLKVYFHYPQATRVEDVRYLVSKLNHSYNIISKIFVFYLMFLYLFIASAVIGLFLRYLLFLILTIYLFLGGCWVNKQWGWVYKYYMLVRNRYTSQNSLSSITMLALLVVSMLGSFMIFVMGLKYIIQNGTAVSFIFSQSFYTTMLFKNYFIIELFYYVCCRTRISLKYFPRFSVLLTILILYLQGRFYCYNISWFMNLHLLLHLFLMSIFNAFENYIGNSKLYNDFTPSEEKPRALFYAGYDISWQNTLPPIWTYFATYFDLNFFRERERSLIDRDYQLLYGRLLGMNERQYLPEEEQINDEEEVQKLNQGLNEHNLIQVNEMNILR